MQEMTRLGSITQDVDGRSRPIAKAAEEINCAVERIVLSCGSNKDAIESLENITGKFVL